MASFLHEPIDYTAHNEEVQQVWDAYAVGTPYRVPVAINGSITNYLLNPALNVHDWSFQNFFEDPDVQIQAQLEYQKWQCLNLQCDRKMGIPDEGWHIRVDFQNSYDAGWVGCPLRYFTGQVPDTVELLREKKELLYELPPDLPITHGLLGRAMEFYDYMQDKCPKMEFEGQPVYPPAAFLGEGTDGPLDLAYKLRGAGDLLVDMLIDQDYYHDLMSYITTNLINRMKRLRELRWTTYPDSPDQGVYQGQHFYFADDAIALISTEQYQEFVYPYHQRIFEEFSDGNWATIHLCGDATRHFSFLNKALHIKSFDTGFPVNHGRLRKELGPDVEISGGPTVMTVRNDSPAEIASEVQRICTSGVMEGGKFIMIAANNLAPCTPIENVQALYHAAKQYGRYNS